MAEFQISGDELVLHLPTQQKILGFHLDIRVPLSAVHQAAPVAKPWLALRGRRMAGTALRGSAAIGTWRHGEGYDFNVVRRMAPGVQVDVRTGRFSRMLITVGDADPVEVAGLISDAAGITRAAPVD